MGSRVDRQGRGGIPGGTRRLPAVAWAVALGLLAVAIPATADVVVKVRPDGTRVMVNTGAPAHRSSGPQRSTGAQRPTAPLSESERQAAADRYRRYRVARARYEALIDAYCEDHGLDPKLVRAVVEVESAYRPAARSHKGAMGLMQLMPQTADELAVDDPYDPDQNLRGGIAYLAAQLERFGRTELALAAYNAGPTAVERYSGVPPFRETREYVEKVLSLYEGRRVVLPGGTAAGRGPSAPSGRKPFIVRNADGGIVLTTDPSD